MPKPQPRRRSWGVVEELYDYLAWAFAIASMAAGTDFTMRSQMATKIMRLTAMFNTRANLSSWMEWL
jgi:hypothetical protein